MAAAFEGKLHGGAYRHPGSSFHLVLLCGLRALKGRFFLCRFNPCRRAHQLSADWASICPDFCSSQITFLNRCNQHRLRQTLTHRHEIESEMYVGMYVSTCVRMHACMYVCMCVCMSLRTYVCMYVCIYMLLHKFMSVKMNMYVYARACRQAGR